MKFLIKRAYLNIFIIMISISGLSGLGNSPFLNAPFLIGNRTGLYIFEGLAQKLDFQFPFTIPVYEDQQTIYCGISVGIGGFANILHSLYAQDVYGIAKIDRYSSWAGVDIDGDGSADTFFSRARYFLPISFKLTFAYELLWGPRILFDMPKFLTKIELYLVSEFGFGYSFIPFFIDYVDGTGNLTSYQGFSEIIPKNLVKNGYLKKVVFSGFHWSIFLRLKFKVHKHLHLSIDIGYPDWMFGIEAAIP